MSRSSKQVTIRVEGEIQYGKESGKSFGVARGNFVDGYKEVHGVDVPQTVWVSILGFGDWEGAVANLDKGDVVIITGEWQQKFYNGQEQMSCVVSNLQYVPASAVESEGEVPESPVRAVS